MVPLPVEFFERGFNVLAPVRNEGPPISKLSFVQITPRYCVTSIVCMPGEDTLSVGSQIAGFCHRPTWLRGKHGDRAPWKDTGGRPPRSPSYRRTSLLNSYPVANISVTYRPIRDLQRGYPFATLIEGASETSW